MPIQPLTALAAFPRTGPTGSAGSAGSSGSSGGTGGTSGTGDSTPGSGSTSLASPTLLDRDAFLKLLVAQLRYQDPTKPMDPTEMVSQTAQLSVVDKLEQISEQLQQAASADRLAIAGTIVGKQIAFNGEDGLPTSAVVRWARFEGGSIVLGTDRWEVPMDAVLAVSGPPATTATPVPPTTPTTPTA